MADPLEIKLTGCRRVVLDVDGVDWRVAFYCPELPAGQVAKLEREAIGSRRGQAKLDELKITRGTGRNPLLVNALMQAAKRPRGDRLSLREAEEVSRYVFGLGYAE